MNNTSANGTIVLFDLYSSTAEIIGYSFAYGILSLIALVGNMMVLRVVYMNSSMRTTINVLLVNLSLSDILYIILSVPGFLQLEICNQRWLLGLPMAKIGQGITIASAGAVVFTLIAIAFERYFAIVHPLKARTRNKSRPTIWPLVVIWTCSTVFALPFFIGITTIVTRHYVKENGQVTLQDITFIDLDIDVDKFRIYYVIIFLGFHVVPFVSLVIMYTRIAWKLWHPDRRLTEQPEGAGGNGTVSRVSERNRRRTTKMVIAVLIIFFVCFFPFHIYFITHLFSDSYENKPTTNGSVMKLLLVLNAAVNPIVYNILSEKFRAAFRSMLTCCPRATPAMTTASSDIMQSSGN